MDHVEFQWLHNEGSRKEALQQLLGCSGQLLKKHFSSVELGRPVRAKDLLRLPLDLVNHMKINPVYVGPRISVIKETTDYIAVHKPSLVHSHPLIYSDQDTVLNYLAQENRDEALKVNINNYDRGLLFRLDYETSGVLVLAKTEEFHARMRHDFEKQMKRKLYLVIVEGDFNQEGSWTHYFKGSGQKGAKQKVSSDPFPEAHSGSIEVKKLTTINNKSLLLVSLKTGLRHQIRAQLSFLGFPILGDELYGGVKAARLFLHAWRYEWDDVIQDDEVDLFDPSLIAAMPKYLP